MRLLRTWGWIYGACDWEIFSVLRRLTSPVLESFQGNESFPRNRRRKKRKLCRTFKGTLFLLVLPRTSGIKWSSEGERSWRFYKSRLTFSQTIVSEVTAKKKLLLMFFRLLLAMFTAHDVHRQHWAQPQRHRSSVRVVTSDSNLRVCSCFVPA